MSDEFSVEPEGVWELVIVPFLFLGVAAAVWCSLLERVFRWLL